MGEGRKQNMTSESTAQGIPSRAPSRAPHPRAATPRGGVGVLTVKHAASWSTVNCSAKIVFFLSLLLFFPGLLPLKAKTRTHRKKHPLPL